ncbi:unnamed protein product [Closterium sp. NIES-65]|nr:unnamed protein product [Closterium sp. NIES-65]
MGQDHPVTIPYPAFPPSAQSALSKLLVPGFKLQLDAWPLYKANLSLMLGYKKDDIDVPNTISPIDPAYTSDLTELVFVYVKITMQDTNPSSSPLAPSANWPFAARNPPVHSFTASFFPSVICLQGYPVTEPIPPPPPPPAGGSNVGVFIGVGVALGVLLLAAIAGVLYVWLVRRQQREQGDRNLDRGRAAVFAAMHSANKNRWWFGGKGSGVGGSLRSKGSKGELTSKRSEGDTGAEKDSKELGDVGSAESGKLVDGNMMQGISSEVFTRESSLGEGVGGDIREGR